MREAEKICLPFLFSMRKLIDQNGIKTFIHIPWMQEWIESGATRKEKIVQADDAFNFVPLIHRAVKLRANTLKSVPLHVFEGEDEVESYPFESSLPLKKLIWLSEVALLLKGGAPILKLMSARGMMTGLQFLNPFSVEIRTKDDSMFFKQRLSDGREFPEFREWTEDEMLFIREYSPGGELGWGTAAADVAMNTAKLQRYLTVFVSKFFEAGGIPATIFSLPGASPEDIKEARSFFKRTFEGIRNAFRVTAVSSEVKPTVITPELRTLVISTLSDFTEKQVAYAFDIPRTVLTADSANFATAHVEYRSFIADTIGPRCTFFEEELNPFLSEFGYRIKFDIQELPVMQEDEASRAKALLDLVSAGVPLEAGLEILGYDLTDKARQILDTRKGKIKVDAQGNLVAPGNGQEQ
jgi:HK97 family phage portal protein